MRFSAISVCHLRQLRGYYTRFSVGCKGKSQFVPPKEGGSSRFVDRWGSTNKHELAGEGSATQRRKEPEYQVIRMWRSGKQAIMGISRWLLTGRGYWQKDSFLAFLAEPDSFRG